MSLRDPRLRCRLARAVALGSMIFYAALVPWHAVSQAIGDTAGPGGLNSLPPCHQTLAQTEAPAKTSLPSKPRTKCPICSGIGALHLAASVPAGFVIVRASSGEALPVVLDQGIVTSGWHSPRGRSPPALSA